MRIAAWLLLAGAAWAQQAPTFKTGVSLVHVDAEVAAADGRILDGFTKDDFRILDEGKEQPVLLFSAGEVALDLILLFDVSGSMRPKVQQVVSAAREGMQELRPGDRVAVMTFDTRTRLVQPFTDDLDRVERSMREDLPREPFNGGTFIQSAVSEAARAFLRERRTERRRAILIITDNLGQRTRRESTVVRELWEADALLTALVVKGGVVQTMRAVHAYLQPMLMVGVRGIAAKTGGDFIPANDPAAEFPESMRRIRSRYSLYYAMPESKPAAHRTVRVELAGEAAQKNPKAKVRARMGYVTPADPR
jgi:VWFA-related protein